MIGTRWN